MMIFGDGEHKHSDHSSNFSAYNLSVASHCSEGKILKPLIWSIRSYLIATVILSSWLPFFCHFGILPPSVFFHLLPISGPSHVLFPLLPGLSPPLAGETHPLDLSLNVTFSLILTLQGTLDSCVVFFSKHSVFVTGNNYMVICIIIHSMSIFPTIISSMRAETLPVFFLHIVFQAPRAFPSTINISYIYIEYKYIITTQ